jgi:predicted transcriptional regulator YdeE
MGEKQVSNQCKEAPINLLTLQIKKQKFVSFSPDTTISHFKEITNRVHHKTPPKEPKNNGTMAFLKRMHEKGSGFFF